MVTNGSAIDVIDLEQYPELRLLAWQRLHRRYIEAREAFDLYEANWRFVDHNALSGREAELIRVLAERFGNGVLNV